SAEQIVELCKGFNSAHTTTMEAPVESQDPPSRPLARHLSDADRLRKVIQELVDTEKSYVKDLSCLFELYLEPLQSETFLTQDEKLLFSLGGSFLYYADHFKLYSGFCANHSKVQKVLERGSFINCLQLKPIRPSRLFWMPEIPPSSIPPQALKAMEKVASHINEMQKIYEDYGTVFDQLVAEQSGTEKENWESKLHDSESKTSIVKVIRSILRENFRRHIKCELPLEKTCKDRLVPLKNRVPVSAKLGTENNSLWELIHTKSEVEGRPETVFQLCCRSLKVLRTSSSSEWPSEPSKGNSLDSDECSLSSGTQSSGCPVAENRQDCKSTVLEKDPPEGLAEFPDGLIKESDILSDEDEDFHQPLKQGSPTKDIELQFQRLRISEEPDMQQPITGPGEQPRLVRGHFCPIKRKANSTKRGRGTLLKAQTRHQSLDSHPETASIDLNLVLEREFSVQSLTSVVNEECFYEA
ncbi:hypothetical protein A6R68_13284, partial [Neotoma lepida]